MTTTEQTIVDALVARLATITARASVTVGTRQHVYGHTVVTAVEGRAVPFADNELPAANVFTPQGEADSLADTFHDHTTSLVIVLHVAQRAAQREIRALRQDVYAAIGSDETLGGVQGLIAIGDPARVTKCIQMADFIGSEQITIPITYRTPKWGV